MFSECCFWELLARPSSIRTLLLSGFVVLALCRLCSCQCGFCEVPFQFDWFIVGLFLWLSSVWLLLLVFLYSSVFHQVPLILNASLVGGGVGGCHPPSCTQLFLWFCSGWSFRSVSIFVVCLYPARSPRVSPHYCFTGGVKFLQGERSAVILLVLCGFVVLALCRVVFVRFCFFWLIILNASLGGVVFLSL